MLMSRKTDIKIFQKMSGQLQKYSTNVFIGYQKKFFSLLDQGKKLAYRNLNQTEFKQENTFNILQLTSCQAEQQFSFTLETPKRTFLLKAQNQKQRANWIKAITKIKKQIIRKKFQKTPNKRTTKVLTSTQNSNHHNISMLNPQSVQSSRVNPLLMTQRTDRTNRSLKKSKMPVILQRTIEQQDLTKLNIKQLIQKVPQDYIKYNIFVGTFKTKVQNLFTTSYVDQTYIFFSSKSLYPEQKILEVNLINNMLPSWAEVNKVYRINQSLKKYMFDIVSIIQMKEGTNSSSLQIRTSEAVFELFCKTVQQRNRLKLTLQMGIKNSIQANINGKLSRKNYDQFVQLHKKNYQDFIELTKQTISKYIPNNHHYEPAVVTTLIESLLPFILEFICIVGHKKQKCPDVILDVLKQIHQQVKIHIKLTWDSSYSVMKGQDILKFLNSLAAYNSVIKEHITDTEFMLGMKELSKIYVRQSWKNFESIILGIVQQEKRENIMPKQEEDQMDFVQTYAVTDLFKFMYEVFELASPCWQHKLHLHNVNKLMQRALSVYIGELKSAIDESVINSKQLVAVANNYFRFCLTIDQFYAQKFSSLQVKTKESYQKIKVQYKELSGIIIDKLVGKIKGNIRLYFQKLSFYQIDSDKLFQVLKKGANQTQSQNFHQIYQKRAYQKIFNIVRQEIIKTIQKQVSQNNKKKNANAAIKKILEHLDSLAYDLVQITKILCKGKIKIQKELRQIQSLLTSSKFQQIQTLIGSSQEETKKAYLNLLNLREDYFVGSALHTQINQIFLNNRNSLRSSGVRRDSIKLGATIFTVETDIHKRASLSNHYYHQFDSRSSVSSYEEQNIDEQSNRLISQGYILKCKVNKNVWQKEYLRLKNGAIYIYDNQKSQRSQNSIKIQEIRSISIPQQKQLKPNFVITYVTLNREKTLQFKCESLQLRDRWMESIALQMKRIRNQEKVKKHKLKLKQKNKNCLVIDYEQLISGKSFFSYSGNT